MREVELKLAVHGSFVMPDLISDDLGIAAAEELPRLETRTTYYDSDDLRLARYGITLRHRTGEEGGPRWTLKLPVPGEDLTAHDEVSFRAPAARVPDEAKNLVTAFVRAAPLAAVASIRTRRDRWLLRGVDGDELAEVVDDVVSVYEGRRVLGRFRELEIEGRRLDRAGLQGVSMLLQEAGAMASEPIPKVVRALGARATGEPDVPPSIAVAPSDPAGRAVQAALAAGLYRLILHDPVTRIGSDAEGVHQMRVATRRIRSDLRTFGPIVDGEWATQLKAEVKWLGGILGAVRDLDVQSARMIHTAGVLVADVRPLFDDITARHERARSVLLGELNGPRYMALLDRLVESVHNPVLTPLAEKSCEDQLPGLVARPWRKLDKAAKKLRRGSPAERYHNTRILAKRTRYAAEAVAGALPAAESKAAGRLGKRCAKLQDVLGDFQDAVVAAGVIEELGRRHRQSGRLNFALGRMAEREYAVARQKKAEFPGVWASVAKNKNHEWLNA
jgi:CHAD domain-containing protein